MKARIVVVGALVAGATSAWSQTTIYESRDKAGPVFSDKPATGATPVEVAPANVVTMPTPAPVAPPGTAASAPAYKSLVFVTPEVRGTVHSNTGEFDVAVRSVPALRSTDRLRVQLDGTTLPGSYRSTARLHISEDDWRRAARSDSNEHTLQVAIVDAQGNVLITSQPLAFFVQRAAVGGTRK